MGWIVAGPAVSRAGSSVPIRYTQRLPDSLALPRHMAMPPLTYVGRFAPSPSGPLHLGSVVAAMASWLDARAHGGRWLLRIEDIDGPRSVAGADTIIIDQLAALGFRHDGPIVWQSARLALYQNAFETLSRAGRVYACGCTRREIADSRSTRQTSHPSGEHPYPGTCRDGLPPGRAPRAWRLRVPPGQIAFFDRWMGRQCQDVNGEVGDFVLRRADGQWAYQLAVVVDDGEQGVTHVVRGADLLGSTARQYVLFDMLGLARPEVMHVPLVTLADGRKLSKQNGAPAADTARPLECLQQAWRSLGFAPCLAHSVESFWSEATLAWANRWDIRRKETQLLLRVPPPSSTPT